MGTQKVSFFAFATLRAVDFGDLKAPPPTYTYTHTLWQTKRGFQLSVLATRCPFVQWNQGKPALQKHNQRQAVDHYSSRGDSNYKHIV